MAREPQDERTRIRQAGVDPAREQHPSDETKVRGLSRTDESQAPRVPRADEAAERAVPRVDETTARGGPRVDETTVRGTPRVAETAASVEYSFAIAAACLISLLDRPASFNAAAL